MAKPDGRVEAGQSLKRAISAQRWNDLCDAADIVHGRRGGVTAGERIQKTEPYQTILARNDTSDDVEHWQAVPITWPPAGYQGSGSISEFGDYSLLIQSIAGADAASLRNVRFGVAVEPISAGSTGRVAFEGVVRCRLTYPNFPSYRGSFVVLDNTNDPAATINPTGHAMYLGGYDQTSEIGLIQIGLTNYTAFAKLTDAWPINTTKELAEYIGDFELNTVLNAYNFHVDLPAGEKRLVLMGMPRFGTADPGTVSWFLVAAQCESD